MDLVERLREAAVDTCIMGMRYHWNLEEEAADEISSLRKLVGETVNPRFLLWRLWHGDKQSAMHEYTAWISQRWSDWCKTTGKSRHTHTKEDHAEFDAYLRRWVRLDIITTSAFSRPLDCDTLNR